MNSCVVMVFPIIMLIGLQIRSAKSRRVLRSAKDAEAECTKYTIDMLSNYYLLADYGNRGGAITRFEQKINAFNGAMAHHNATQVNNEFIPKSLTVLIVMIWIIFGGTLLVNGEIAMGTFL